MTGTLAVISLLLSFGAAYVVGHSHLSLPVRTLLSGSPSGSPGLYPPGLRGWILRLLECPACLGFWFGLGQSFVLPPLVPQWYWHLMFAFATSASNLILAKFTQLY